MLARKIFLNKFRTSGRYVFDIYSNDIANRNNAKSRGNSVNLN